MERIIGRSLNAGEVVHHINGIRNDNSDSNLFLFDSMAAHNNAHASFEALLGGLLADGLIRFNRKSGRYER